MERIFLICLVIVWAYMTAWFLAALLKKDNSLADVAWGPGFILVAGVTLFGRGEFAARQILVSGLVLVWGLRLSLHVFARNKRTGEDPRYAEWRRKWGKMVVLKSYLIVFLLQGLCLLVVSLPVMLVNSRPQKALGALDVLGVILWLAGFLAETVADLELARFKRDPLNRGKIMTEGLWKYSRHPNYFGESVMWGALFLFALSTRWGWLTVASPLLITFLLLRVSGVPPLEKRYEGRADFREYARRTSVFFPWAPKKSRPSLVPPSR
jgi:steroid 5-alpha reductase family enzyme